MPMQGNQSAGGNVGAGVTCKVVVKQDQLLIRVYTNSCFMEGVFEENRIIFWQVVIYFRTIKDFSKCRKQLLIKLIGCTMSKDFLSEGEK